MDKDKKNEKRSGGHSLFYFLSFIFFIFHHLFREPSSL